MTDKKRYYVAISSSDESKSSSPESGDDVVEIRPSTSCDDAEEKEDDCNPSEDEAQVDEDEDFDYASVDTDDSESMCKKVIQLIQGGTDIQELKLDECKAYLRRHKLRLAGTKEECIERIKEHHKLKDGNGEVYYPRSTFIIDCTGDVCKGDIVLFQQKVNQISGKVKRRRSFQRRIVAGRIVKESYGSAKQQHTFTVEVLWSRGTKKLDPLFALLVKGRNLYKMKTFRQAWKNEHERLEVLSEKHRRGAAARSIRAMRKTKAVVKNGKDLHHLSSSRKRQTSYARRKHEVLGGSNKWVCSESLSLGSNWNGGLRGRQNQVREYPILRCYYPPHFPTEAHDVRFASTSLLPHSHPPPYPEWEELYHGPHPPPYPDREEFYHGPNPPPYPEMEEFYHGPHPLPYPEREGFYHGPHPPLYPECEEFYHGPNPLPYPEREEFYHGPHPPPYPEWEDF